VGTLNTFTVAPQVRVAPVAVSPDGRYLAWASAPNTVIVGSADGREPARFDIEIEPDEFGGPPGTERISGLAFSRDGSALAVSHSSGVAALGCFATLAGRPPEIVAVEVSEALRVGEPATLHWTTDGGPFTTVDIRIGPISVPSRALENSITWYPPVAGASQIELTAANSIGATSVVREVDVAP
jgi:WD40 repeat protein